MRTLSPSILQIIARVSSSSPVGTKGMIRLLVYKNFKGFSASLISAPYVERAPAIIGVRTIVFPAIKTTKGWQPERPINLEAAINKFSRRQGVNAESCGVGRKVVAHSLDKYDKNY